jgi:hypothetical protein
MSEGTTLLFMAWYRRKDSIKYCHILTCETNVDIIVEVLKSYNRQEEVGRT